MRCGQLRYPIDVAIALEHIALQAVEEGLGTCWVGAFDEAAVKQAIGIPADEEIRVVQLMSLGYPADEPKPGTAGGSKYSITAPRSLVFFSSSSITSFTFLSRSCQGFRSIRQVPAFDPRPSVMIS